jgi:RNA polymerase sigma-70 factor (ECF subfamily)
MLSAAMPSRFASAGTGPHRPFPELDVEAPALERAVRGLIAYVLRAAWDDADVEDACHEVFRRALEGRRHWTETLPLRPWLLGIARHVALDAVRARRRAAVRAGGGRPSQDFSQESEPAALLEALADPAPGPDQYLQLAEQRARVEAAMAALPPDHREALWLFHVEGLEYREIASRLGVPLGTICTWMLRARRRLAAELGPSARAGGPRTVPAAQQPSLAGGPTKH